MDDHKRRNKNRTCHSHCVEMGLKLTFSLLFSIHFPPFPTLNIIFPHNSFPYITWDSFLLEYLLYAWLDKASWWSWTWSPLRVTSLPLFSGCKVAFLLRWATGPTAEQDEKGQTDQHRLTRLRWKFKIFISCAAPQPAIQAENNHSSQSYCKQAEY